MKPITMQIEDEDATQQAAGALSNGTKVKKIRPEKGDLVEEGHEGIIVGSISLPDNKSVTIGEYEDIKYLYFVRWEGMPEDSVAAVISNKIQEI